MLEALPTEHQIFGEDCGDHIGMNRIRPKPVAVSLPLADMSY